jgi:hypothetical protein
MDANALEVPALSNAILPPQPTHSTPPPNAVHIQTNALAITLTDLCHDAAGVCLLGNQAGQGVHHQAGALGSLLCVQDVCLAINLQVSKVWQQAYCRQHPGLIGG